LLLVLPTARNQSHWSERTGRSKKQQQASSYLHQSVNTESCRADVWSRLWREGGSNGGARSGRKQEAGAEEGRWKVRECGVEGKKGAFDRARPGRSGRRERRSHEAIPVLLPSSSAVVVVVLSWARSPSL